VTTYYTHTYRKVDTIEFRAAVEYGKDIDTEHGEYSHTDYEYDSEIFDNYDEAKTWLTRRMKATPLNDFYVHQGTIERLTYRAEPEFEWEGDLYNDAEEVVAVREFYDPSNLSSPREVEDWPGV
jgi:hypothetical protein